MKLSIVILAAGHGTRMHSKLPKILHPLAGVPMIERIVNAAKKLDPQQVCVVYGPNLETHREKLQYLNVNWVLQKEQLGTGHAVLQALPQIPDDHQVLVLYGDIPLISATSLNNLLSDLDETKVGLLVTSLEDPTGFGRIIRGRKNNITAIVEEKDASSKQKQIKEINTGIITASAHQLKKWLPELKNTNAQHEYYLTDIIEKAVNEGIAIHGVPASYNEEVQGVNNLYQLGKLERFYQYQQAEKLMRQGVMIMDPTRFDLRGKLQTGYDVVIDINVVFEGNVAIGNNCKIAPNVILRNVTIGNNVIIKANSVIEDSIIADNSFVGPFARLRPGTQVGENAEIGNFVEIKKSVIGEGTKAHHVGYLGDANIGKNVNVGAGTITCNYDGAKKHITTIEDNSFIGSGTELVAPVTVEKNSYVGAGSTITENTPAGKLTVARERQTTIENWAPPEKAVKEKN